MHYLTIFARRWGLMLMGIILAFGGLIYGVIPHQAPYQTMPKSFVAHYLSGRGTGYMQLVGSPTLYIVNEGEFLPAFSADYLNHGQIVISFLYRTDEITNIDASTGNNVHLTGPAFTVEQIKLYFKFGQPPEVFSTREYFQNPNGYYQHNWMAGIALSLVGLIFCGFGVFMPIIRGKKQLEFAYNPAATHKLADKQYEKANQIQVPETDPGNVEYKEYSTQTAQPSTISHVE